MMRYFILFFNVFDNDQLVGSNSFAFNSFKYPNISERERDATERLNQTHHLINIIEISKHDYDTLMTYETGTN